MNAKEDILQKAQQVRELTVLKSFFGENPDTRTSLKANKVTDTPPETVHEITKDFESSVMQNSQENSIHMTNTPVNET